MMIDKARIQNEAAHFFEWPDPNRKDHVTLVSCRIFAATIAEMAVAEERERCIAAVFAWAHDAIDRKACATFSAPTAAEQIVKRL